MTSASPSAAAHALPDQILPEVWSRSSSLHVGITFACDHPVDRLGLIPVDDDAERAVTGCAIASLAAARLATSRLTAEDFHHPSLWHLVTLAANQPVAPGEQRTQMVADKAGVPAAWLQQLVDQRPVARDTNGWYATRVRAAAVARRRIRFHLDQLARLGVDTDTLTRP